MVPSPEPTRYLGSCHNHRLRVETLHERENEGGDGLPEEVLEEHDAHGSDL